jgi:hypothetical protein
MTVSLSALWSVKIKQRPIKMDGTTTYLEDTVTFKDTFPNWDWQMTLHAKGA